MNLATEKLKEVGLVLKLDNERLAVSPKRLITKEIQEFIVLNRDRLISELRYEPDPLRDFCGVCWSLLTEQPNGEWFCPTQGCTDSRINGRLR